MEVVTGVLGALVGFCLLPALVGWGLGRLLRRTSSRERVTLGGLFGAAMALLVNASKIAQGDTQIIGPAVLMGYVLAGGGAALTFWLVGRVRP